ncbi:hypothetical protein [Paenibacillus monticola]|nr:hypothetical protein [Paenibacillus monticola]
MKDWVILLTASIQCYTAYLLLKKTQEDNKKGTKRSHGGKRK